MIPGAKVSTQRPCPRCRGPLGGASKRRALRARMAAPLCCKCSRGMGHGGGRVLVIMVKEPRPGRVKTRLAADIGTVAATWWFRHQVQRLLRRVGRDRRWRTVLAVSPDVAVASRFWPGGLPKIRQRTGDLGARMARVLRGSGAGSRLVIGADIPSVTAGEIAVAFSALQGHDAVFGPAPDGGYWLIGLRGMRPVPGMFKDVRWSTEHALADTARSMTGLRIGWAATLADVDTGVDLEGQ